ncbi:transposable element Tcb2 transposase [Trichonephila clavipes]|nr:transposable element Tcb2 transposase [Trichonephila clavipes]
MCKRETELKKRSRERIKGFAQGENSLISDSKHHFSSTAYSNRVTRVVVYRRLNKGGLFAHQPELRIPLKVGYQRRRLEWYKEHKNWTSHQWSRVFLMDESPFSVTSESQLHLIWKEVWTWFHPSTSRKETVTVVLELSSG